MGRGFRKLQQQLKVLANTTASVVLNPSEIAITNVSTGMQYRYHPRCNTVVCCLLDFMIFFFFFLFYPLSGVHEAYLWLTELTCT